MVFQISRTRIIYVYNAIRSNKERKNVSSNDGGLSVFSLTQGACKVEDTVNSIRELFYKIIATLVLSFFAVERTRGFYYSSSYIYYIFRMLFLLKNGINLDNFVFRSLVTSKFFDKWKRVTLCTIGQCRLSLDWFRFPILKHIPFQFLNIQILLRFLTKGNLHWIFSTVLLIIRVYEHHMYVKLRLTILRIPIKRRKRQGKGSKSVSNARYSQKENSWFVSTTYMTANTSLVTKRLNPCYEWNEILISMKHTVIESYEISFHSNRMFKRQSNCNFRNYR